MAALSTNERSNIWRGLMRYWSTLPIGDADRSIAALKTEIYNPANNTGMIADIDGWVDTHSANTTSDSVGLNGAINSSYRAKFTTGQKGLALMAVVAMRTGNVEILKRALGQEVT